MAMTADGPIGSFLSRLYKTKWYNNDIEQETGCGVVPIEYKNRSFVHACDWAIGLEWFLLVNDPWRVAMSTDHPNGGSFLAYPQIIRLLMDRTYRRNLLQTLPAAVRERTVLADLDREYTLGEIAIITRAGPARLLGLAHKGHLGVGADADITIYTPDANPETMFSVPRYVVKAGQILVEQGDIREESFGRTFRVAPEYDREVERDIREWFEQSYSIRWRNFPIEEPTSPESEVLA
jgi:formylmethanofuran dehydrogenase subunit A